VAQPEVSVKSLVSSYETRVVGRAPGPPRKRGCVSSPCSPRAASPIRGPPGPPHHRSLAGPGQRPSPCRGDLVKYHLVFAVREEVEVLKEQIRDLAERNAALEQENGLLRARASPEQLAQLPSSGRPRLGPPPPNGRSSPPWCAFRVCHTCQALCQRPVPASHTASTRPRPST
uniref:TSC22 domain family protein 1 n=1 Tax=Chinchilla lanigera TaxID=34839 RepID=A0A8C2UVD8_CHILA